MVDYTHVVVAFEKTDSAANEASTRGEVTSSMSWIAGCWKVSEANAIQALFQGLDEARTYFVLVR